jgi:hypothetical protein
MLTRNLRIEDDLVVGPRDAVGERPKAWQYARWVS